MYLHSDSASGDLTQPGQSTWPIVQMPHCARSSFSPCGFSFPSASSRWSLPFFASCPTTNNCCPFCIALIHSYPFPIHSRHRHPFILSNPSFPFLSLVSPITYLSIESSSKERYLGTCSSLLFGQSINQSINWTSCFVFVFCIALSHWILATIILASLPPQAPSLSPRVGHATFPPSHGSTGSSFLGTFDISISGPRLPREPTSAVRLPTSPACPLASSNHLLCFPWSLSFGTQYYLCPWRRLYPSTCQTRSFPP